MSFLSSSSSCLDQGCLLPSVCWFLILYLLLPFFVSLVLFLVLLITFGLLNSLFEYVQPLRHSLLVIAAQAVDALYNAAQMSQLLVVGWAYAA